MYKYFTARTLNLFFKRYSRLSFLGGVATATLLQQALKPGEALAKTSAVPGVRMSFPAKLPVIFLDKDLSCLNGKLKIEEFKARAPLYPDKERLYEGYDLLKVLSLCGIDISKINADLVIFEAKDGFVSSIPISLIEKYRPKLATCQKSLPQGQNWETVKHALNGQVDGGPYYLMWPGKLGKDVVENNWAFGVTKITFDSFENKFGKLMPGAEKHKKAALQFMANCACCHLFFKEGSGDVGPRVETMVSKYRSGYIAAYAANPHPGSLMPPQKLSKKDLEAIEEYIRYKYEEGPTELPSHFSP